MLIDTLDEKLEMLLENRNNNQFIFNYLAPMFNNFGCVLLITTEEIHINALCVKAFQVRFSANYRESINIMFLANCRSFRKKITSIECLLR